MCARVPRLWVGVDCSQRTPSLGGGDCNEGTTFLGGGSIATMLMPIPAIPSSLMHRGDLFNAWSERLVWLTSLHVTHTLILTPPSSEMRTIFLSVGRFDSPNFNQLATVGVSIQLQHSNLRPFPRGAFSVHKEMDRNVAVLR